MSTASDILAKIRACRDLVACTLEGGYAVERDGGRILFEAARTERMSRNTAGRVTSHTVRYYDGSRLRFTWSPDRGPCYALLPPDTGGDSAPKFNNVVTP